MEKGDIGVTLHKHVACWFEGLIVTPEAEPVKEEKPGLLRRLISKPEDVPAVPHGTPEWKASIASRWRVNEMPLKSVIHLTQQLGIGVEVYTYYEDELRETIEHWLARKGANVQVHCYANLADLMDDLKYNRDVHTLFTPYEEDALRIGMHRATVTHPDGTFGF